MAGPGVWIGRGGGGGGGGIAETTLTLDTPTSDYSHTVGATLSGGVLDGWRLQNSARFDSIEEKASGWIDVTYTPSGRAQWGYDDESNYNAPALLPPSDVMGPLGLYVAVRTAGNVNNLYATAGVGAFRGTVDNQTGYIGITTGRRITSQGNWIWRSLGNGQAAGYDAGAGHAWTTQQWLRIVVTNAGVTQAYANEATSLPTWTQYGSDQLWDRAGAVRSAGIIFGGENAVQETIRVYAFGMTYYPPPS